VLCGKPNWEGTGAVVLCFHGPDLGQPGGLREEAQQPRGSSEAHVQRSHSKLQGSTGPVCGGVRG